MGAPNVNNNTYVNSGPGVGLSSSGGSNSVSSGSISKIKNTANNIANLLKTSTSAYADKIRESVSNPYSSARGADAYSDFMGNYGMDFDMDEYFDKVEGLSNKNNQWSADQAQKQMDFQKMSNESAMAWSANEAQKSRDWTERLANNAHQREVQDLVKAGLNPILSANGGAYSGSGATGQAFSSNGAMGQTDNSVTGAVSSLMSNVINTAKELTLTRMSLAQSKYNADMNYASSKLATDASIYNNNNSVSAQKAISALNRDSDIRKASISADASRYAASASAGAIMASAATNAAAARYSADQHRAASAYSADKGYESSIYKSDKDYDLGMYRATHDIKTDPVTAGFNMGKALGDTGIDVIRGYKDILDEMFGENRSDYRNGGSGRNF